MSNFSKIVIVILIILSGLFINEKFGSNIRNFVSGTLNIEKINFPLKIGADSGFPAEIIDPPDMIPEKTAETVDIPSKNAEKNTASIYFLTLDNGNNSIYKRVEREVPKNEDKFEYSIKSLLKGPGLIEKSAGAYSEIPVSTKLLGVKQTKNKIIIDFSSDFQYGGGTDSIYSRMMQLIKTALNNTDKKVYLYLDGKQANIIGGEGIMISQPLTEKSLDM